MCNHSNQHLHPTDTPFTASQHQLQPKHQGQSTQVNDATPCFQLSRDQVQVAAAIPHVVAYNHMPQHPQPNPRAPIHSDAPACPGPTGVTTVCNNEQHTQMECFCQVQRTGAACASTAPCYTSRSATIQYKQYNVRNETCPNHQPSELLFMRVCTQAATKPRTRKLSTHCAFHRLLLLLLPWHAC